MPNQRALWSGALKMFLAHSFYTLLNNDVLESRQKLIHKVQRIDNFLFCKLFIKTLSGEGFSVFIFRPLCSDAAIARAKKSRAEKWRGKFMHNKQALIRQFAAILLLFVLISKACK